MTYLTPEQEAEQLRQEPAIGVLTVIPAFPGSRLTARRTPEEFRHFWAELGRLSDARKRADEIAVDGWNISAPGCLSDRARRGRLPDLRRPLRGTCTATPR